MSFTVATKQAKKSSVKKRSSGEAPSLTSAPREPSPLPAIGSAFQTLPGTAADHHRVHEFLTRVFHGPSTEAFATSLEDPFYEPCNRLLLRRGNQLIAHALLSSREMRWGGVELPVSQVTWIATLPEFRGQGHTRRLLQAVEAKMAQDGALLGIVTTSGPRFFSRAGWVLCQRSVRWIGSARNLLTRLGGGRETSSRSLSIRPWRHVELPALFRIFAKNMDATSGMFVRTEAYWRWLVSRRAFDHIYVAVNGSGRSQLDETSSNILGYAITKDDEVLELMADRHRPDIARKLLRRVCGDAIEFDCHHLALHAQPGNPLGELFNSVGGQQEPSCQPHGDYFLAKVLDPMQVLERLRGELHRRAEAAGLERPSELGISVANGGESPDKYRLALTRRSVKVTAGKLGRNYVHCQRQDFDRLLLGVLDVEAALSQKRLKGSTRLARQTVAALFPSIPFWRPPLEDLME